MLNMTKKLNRMARCIIRSNEYTTLATVDAHGKPWASIVAYAFDRSWNIYFVSIPKSKHGQHIQRRKLVTCTIFDSGQDWGKGVGLQIEARCKIIANSDFEHVSRVYFNRKYPFGVVEPETKKYFKKSLESTNSLYKFYKITPKTVWMNNPYSKEDERIKIDLKAVPKLQSTSLY